MCVLNDNVCVCSMRMYVCAQWGCVCSNENVRTYVCVQWGCVCSNENGCVCSMTMYVCTQMRMDGITVLNTVVLNV